MFDIFVTIAVFATIIAGLTFDTTVYVVVLSLWFAVAAYAIALKISIENSSNSSEKES